MAEQDIQITPFFMESPRGRLFCLYLAPQANAIRGGILYLHPFAEEMHKSRRMAALQARALAAQGYAVLQIDLTGSGDSAGDFGDASWSAWKADAQLAHQWLAETINKPIGLWGLRTGGLLALDISRQLPAVDRLILWQPVTNGDLFLNQFLRIKLANEMLTSKQSKTNTKELRTSLANGNSVEVAGYRLSPTMARELAQIQFPALPPPCPVFWLEAGLNKGAQITPASMSIIDAWHDAGAVVHSKALTSDPFWNTQEITESPEFIAATLESFEI
jgi:exosortase A-associated hydrolase 2